MRRSLFVMVLCVFCFGVSVQVTAQDVSGSMDHPLITRFPDSTITWYEEQGYEPYQIAVGPVTGYRAIDEWEKVEGKITRINYMLEGERSFYEVYSNYLSAIKKAGFEIMAEGFDKNSSAKGAIGQRGFLGVHYIANPIPPGKSYLMQGSATSGGSGYVAAKLKRSEDTVFIVLGIAQYRQDAIVTMVDIIEQKVMEDDLITVDAEAMSKDIDIYGKVALYGIFFDYDKATITAESADAMKEIATLLTNRADLELYVVGHTDMKGSLDYNINLSQRRAASVVDALAKDHGIDASRLTPKGVGPLVPVMTNKNDKGRASNRRVELVAK